MEFTVIIESHTGKCNDEGCREHVIQINSRLLSWQASDWRERFTFPDYDWHRNIVKMTGLDEHGFIVWEEDRQLDHLLGLTVWA